VLYSEGRLIWKDRWIIGLTVLLVALSIWAGPVGTFRYAASQLNRFEELREVYQDEFNDFVLDDQVTADLRENVLLLHPDIGVNYLLAILAVLGTMVLPIWGAQLVGQEFKNRTAKARAAHAGWTRVILAKMAWLLVLSAALALLFVLVGSVSGQVTWRAALQSLWLAEEVVPPELTVSVVRQILVAVMGLFLHGLIGLLFALVARSAMAGAGRAGPALCGGDGHRGSHLGLGPAPHCVWKSDGRKLRVLLGRLCRRADGAGTAAPAVDGVGGSAGVDSGGRDAGVVFQPSPGGTQLTPYARGGHRLRTAALIDAQTWRRRGALPAA